jgi:hypothetical protein
VNIYIYSFFALILAAIFMVILQKFCKKKEIENSSRNSLESGHVKVGKAIKKSELPDDIYPLW